MQEPTSLPWKRTLPSGSAWVCTRSDRASIELMDSAFFRPRAKAAKISAVILAFGSLLALLMLPFLKALFMIGIIALIAAATFGSLAPAPLDTIRHVDASENEDLLAEMAAAEKAWGAKKESWDDIRAVQRELLDCPEVKLVSRN